MKEYFPLKRIFSLILLFYGTSLCAGPALEEAENKGPSLKEMYDYHCNTCSDIYEHIPVLYQLSSECSSVVEIGARSMVSTWGILYGLSHSRYENPSYIGIDLEYPHSNQLHLAKTLAGERGIDFKFWRINDMQIELEPTDMLFIDSLHTYCHLSYELETFSPKVQKYICICDTSNPWENRDDTEYHGNYSEYPASYNRMKRGLWLAVEDFLQRHPEWVLLERRTNNHGFTILKRKEDAIHLENSFVRDIVKNFPIVTRFTADSRFCEEYFTAYVVHQIANVYDVFYHHSNGGFTELGFYHIPSNDERRHPMWNRSNYNELFK